MRRSVTLEAIALRGGKNLGTSLERIGAFTAGDDLRLATAPAEGRGSAAAAREVAA